MSDFLARAIDSYCRLLSVLMVLLLALMVVLVFGNVVLRYAFESGITVSEELSRWLFLWMTFLGAIVALREHAHLGTDALLLALPKRGKQACVVIGQVLMLYATWLMLQGSWAQMMINVDVQAPVTGASVAIFYASGVVFAISAGVMLLRELWRTVTGQASEAELIMTRESEELTEVRELHIGEKSDR